MNIFHDNQLPFWAFFHQLEKQLSYERWIDKYKQLLQLLFSNDISYDVDGSELLKVCKALFLQDIKDEQRFTELFKTYWALENRKWLDFFTTIISQKSRKGIHPQIEKEKPLVSKKNQQESKETIGETTTNRSGTNEQTKTITESTDEYELFYFTPDFDLECKEDCPHHEEQEAKEYNFNDEYLPITRREMVKGLQYLRRPEKQGTTTEIDIIATTQKIAKDSIFMEPIFKPGVGNRDDTIIFFVDCNGSMMPFHELSNRLVNTAITMGGHKNASVYYYENAPTDFVFEKPQLTQPVKLTSLTPFMHIRRSIAVVISDIGYARSFGDPERFEYRKQELIPFLDFLNNHCAHILWLNPVPANRWDKSSSDFIKQYVLRMTSIFDEGINPFQTAIRTMFKKQYLK